jgi:tetratricopeptide (TPR) repeat protein
VVAGTSATVVQQWDTRTGQPIAAGLPHPEPVRIFRYSPDGTVLAVACLDGAVYLWDSATGWPLGPPLWHPHLPVELAFADGGRALLAVTRAGAVHAWPVPRPVLGGKDGPARFEAWLHARGGVRFAGEQIEQLGPEQWQTACRDLARRWPQADPALADRPADEPDWHRRRAREAGEVGNDRGELYHLERLAALRPGEATLHARIARVHAHVGARLSPGPGRDRQWSLARAALKRAAWDGPGADNWDRRGALEAASAGAWDEALWYLDRVVARDRRDWSALAERAAAHAGRGDREKRDADLRAALAAGGAERPAFLRQRVIDVWAREDRWQEVAEELSKALKGRRADLGLVRLLALALVKKGDRRGHAGLCQGLLRSLPPKVNVGAVVGVAELCALSPEALGDWSNLAEAVGRAARALEAAEGKAGGEQKKALREVRRSWLTTEAALLHRAGRHDRAVARLNEAMKLSPDGQGGPVEWAWLALAQAAREKAPHKEARRWLEKAERAAPKRDGPGLWAAVLLEVLLAEARRAVRAGLEV